MDLQNGLFVMVFYISCGHILSTAYQASSASSRTWRDIERENENFSNIRERIKRQNTLPPNPTLPVNVSVNLVFESVREIGVDATIDFYVEYQWYDEREKGEDLYISGVDSKDYAWTPDVYFLLSRSTEYSPISQYLIIENGTVLFDQKVSVKIPCIPDAFMYPFDTVYCNIVLSSYGYTSDQLNLNWANTPSIVFPTEYHDIEYTGFFMLPNRTEQTQYEAVYPPYKYTVLEGKIYFERLYSVYIYQMFIPATFLVGLSWITFWINPQATPARAAIGVTTILTMLTLNTNQQQDQNSAYISIKMSLMDVYLWICFMYVIAAMVMFSVSDYTLLSQSKRATTAAACAHLQACENIIASNSIGASEKLIKHATNDHHMQFDYGKQLPTACSQRRSIDFFCRLLFPTTFLLFNIGFWCYVMAKR